MTPTDQETQAEMDRRLELARKARGWSHFLRLIERIRREDSGEALIRIER